MKRFIRTILIFALIYSTSILKAQENSEIHVGKLIAKTGEKVHGNLLIEEGVDEATLIPLTIIKGAKSGKVLTLIAGIHGTEYVPIIALQNIANKITPKSLNGTLIIVHVANIPSFHKRTVYFSPVDNKNLNRVFPGNKDGTQTERIAYTLSSEIIDKSDYVIDLHGGEFNEQFISCVLSIKDAPSNELLENVKTMTRSLGLDYITANAYDRIPDSLRYTNCERSALRKGIPATTVEVGDRGLVDPRIVETAERSIVNVMRKLSMLEGEAFINNRQQYLVDIERIRSSNDGIFYKHVDAGEMVQKGDYLGYSTDYFGNKIDDYYAPISGLLFMCCNAPSLNKGDLVFKIGKTVKDL